MGLAPFPSFLIAVISVLGIYVSGNGSRNNTMTNTNSTLEDTTVPPAHSGHRLLPSVMHVTSLATNSTTSFSSNTTTDDVPFLPSGIVSSFISARSHEEPKHNLESNSDKKDFTPSYFIGEVIPEPYVPDRFQHTRSNHVSRNRSYQNPVSSQTALAFQKILPIVEQIQQGALPPVEEDPGTVDYHPYNHHVVPVHEPSMEDIATTPKYSVNYGEYHLSERPYMPYKFEGQHYNMFSTKPVTFDDSQIAPITHYKNPNKYEEHINHQEKHKGTSQELSDWFGDQEEHYHKGHQKDQHILEKHKGSSQGLSDLFGDQEGHYYKGHQEEHIKALKDFSSIASPSKFQSNINYEDYINDHSHHYHPESDFVFPPPLYPTEPDIPHGHLKEVHYKVYKQKPWRSLLPLAAALVPIGLLVAALNPSVLYVNSSQPMPPKHRSLEGLEGLEALEGLKLDLECQKRAFCEAAVQGAKPQATSAQRSLWKLANSIPHQHVITLGLGETMKAVKSNSCASLKCGGVSEPQAVTS